MLKKWYHDISILFSSLFCLGRSWAIAQIFVNFRLALQLCWIYFTKNEHICNNKNKCSVQTDLPVLKRDKYFFLRFLSTFLIEVLIVLNKSHWNEKEKTRPYNQLIFSFSMEKRILFFISSYSYCLKSNLLLV